MKRGQLKTCRLRRGHIHSEAKNEKGPAIQKSEQYRLDREEKLRAWQKQSKCQGGENTGMRGKCYTIKNPGSRLKSRPYSSQTGLKKCFSWSAMGNQWMPLSMPGIQFSLRGKWETN